MEQGISTLLCGTSHSIVWNSWPRLYECETLQLRLIWWRHGCRSSLLSRFAPYSGKQTNWLLVFTAFSGSSAFSFNWCSAGSMAVARRIRELTVQGIVRDQTRVFRITDEQRNRRVSLRLQKE